MPRQQRFAVVVEAENDNAHEFYRRYGFIPFREHPAKLFLPMHTGRALFRK
jgi:hypothetical protein